LKLVAAGSVGLCAPVIWGCQDKQQSSGMTEKPPATAGSPPATPGSQPAAAGGKMSQAQAQYQSQPKGDQKCSKCLHFIAASNTCQVVDGQVSPEGWCMLFAAKPA
jgi:hypothetical protein